MTKTTKQSIFNGKALILVLIGVVSLFAIKQADAARIYVLLHVDKQEISWGDADLTSKVLDRLSGKTGLEVDLVHDTLWKTSESGSSFFSAEYLSRYGSNLGARYVISFSRLKTELKTKKGLSAPLVLSRYSAVGTLSGILRVVDTHKGRVILDKSFEIEKRGPNKWQVFDDNPHRADAMVSAADKPDFLEALEWRAASELVDLIAKEIKLR